MKVKHFILALFAIVAFTSCYKTQVSKETPKEDSNNYLIKVTMAPDSTKVAVNGVVVTWAWSDRIYVCEVKDNQFIDKKEFVIQSILEDGKTAFFYGPTLTPGCNYRAFRCNECDIMEDGNQYGFKAGALSVESWINAYNGYNYASGMFLSSGILTAPIDNQRNFPNFIFRHEEFVVEYNIKLSDNFNGNNEIKSISFDALNGKTFNWVRGMNPDGTVVGSPTNNTSVYNMSFEGITLSKTTPFVARHNMWWNPEITDVKGNFKIKIINANNEVASKLVPAKILQKGKLYTVDIIIDKFENLADRDRENLMAIYNEMKGDAWEQNANWCSDKPLSEWEGVQVDREGRVTSLLIKNSDVSICNISDRIFELDELSHIVLRNVSGELSSKIALLTNLKQLYISSGGSKMPGDFLYGKLSGNLPPSMEQLQKLEYFEVDNQLFNGAIPTWLGEMPNLKSLKLSNCYFTGGFPTFLMDKLNSYEDFNVVNNRLKGELPQSLLSHPKWITFQRAIVMQQKGYGFNLNNIEFFFPHFTSTDMNGVSYSTKDIIEKNELTIFHKYVSGDYRIPTLSKIYNNTHDKGLEIITYSLSNIDDVGYSLPWHQFINQQKYPNGLVSNDLGVSHVSVIDKSGKIVFDSELISSNDTYDRLEAFVNNYFSLTEYESTDYSQDGKVMELQRATIGNGVNIVIVGDGFIDKDMNAGGKYEQRMNEALTHLFSVEPMKSYRSYFNVYAVKAVSANEGAGLGKNTVFDTSFGESTIINGNDNKVSDYAGKAGVTLENLTILVVLNSPKYAGTCSMYTSGKSIAYCPYTDNSNVEFGKVIHHETIGHGFGRLLDEYTHTSGFITQVYIDQFNSSRKYDNSGYNMTLSLDDIPWKHFFGQPNYSMVGTYEGGYYFKRGVWRAEQNQCMNDNVPYFNGPSRELIVKRIKKLAGENHTWEDFVLKDKYEPYVDKSRSFGVKKPFVPLAPPVMIDDRINPSRKR